MGIYTNITALRKENLSVVYENLPGNIHLAGKEYVTLVFKSASLEPLLLTNEQLEQEFNKSLFVTTNKQSSVAPFKLTPAKQLEITRTDIYLKTLYEIGGKQYFVGGLNKRKKAIADASNKLGDENPPSPATLAKWVEEDKARVGGMKAKIAETVKKSRKSKFSDELKLLAIELADEKYFGQNESFQGFYNDFVEVVKAEFDDYPSRETVRGWFNEVIDPKLLHKGLSRSERKKLLRNALQKFKVSRPLERVEADGATISIGLKDDEGNYLGKFTIVFLLDVYTRCILGYEMHIGSGEPASTVISAFRHAICPKSQGSYKKTWFCFGVPELLVVDGGSGFISIETHSYVLKTAGSEIEVLSSYSPWLKPFVERFIGTFRKQCAAKIAGYVGKQDNQKKLEYNIEQRATHTIDEVRRFIEMWIVDDYHHTSHSGLNGLTPAKMWQKALDSGWTPTVPVDEENVMLPAGKTKQATISGDACHLGVTINRTRYNDEDGRLKEAGLWLKAKNEDPVVVCKYSDDDIYAITVVCPINGDEFRVETINDGIPKGMSTTEFAAKYPSAYSNKGVTSGNSLSNNPEVKAGKVAESEVVNKRQSSKTRAASTEDIEEEIHNLDPANPEPTDEDPYPPESTGTTTFTPYKSV